MPHDALHARGNQEIFLHQAEPASFCRGVIRIQEAGNLLGQVLVMQGPPVISIAQLAVDPFRRILGLPQPQGIDGPVMVPRHGHIIRDGPDRIEFFIDTFQVAPPARTHVGVAPEPDIDGLIGAFGLPGEPVAQPGIRQFHLLPVNDALIKKAVLIADAAPVSRQLQGCHGIDEAGGKTAQPAIAQARIRFHGHDLI